MKILIDAPGSMQAMCQWHKDGICKLTDIEIDMLIDAVRHGTDAVEMLKDLKAEIMATGNWSADCEIPNEGVKDCLAIINKHMEKLRGDADGKAD